MRASWIVLVALQMALAGRAHADNWLASGHLTPASPKSCPNLETLRYALTLDGSQFSGVSPAGKTFSGPVNPDGSVRVEFQGVPQVGTVTIVGNAQARQLDLTGSARSECHYTLKAAADTSAQMQAGGEWAIGRWEGNLVTVGTSAGSMGLTQSPRLLLVDKDGNGK